MFHWPKGNTDEVGGRDTKLSVFLRPNSMPPF